ncbi:DNA-processing protein DprA [Streptococcus sp. DD13]|uniref:DNA-processing protein DprA n=1 Tax=Streptococcus sp. DD13 TaxID=1777881 RepID=UPI000798101A|nr:DNA-processing protein DprA [Streptococcus sp. DD13]KXT78749.1 Rossmann fold nucleotide-binding protein Smf [Streptococcus sp. DD13]
MNNFELYKLQRAGLQNHQILKVIHYAKMHKKSLSLRDVAVVSECRKPVLFMENYRSLDLLALKKEFRKYPTISLLEEDYPEQLKEMYDPPVLLFYQGNKELLKLPKIAVVGARDATKIGIQSVEKVIAGLEGKFVIVSGLAKGIDAAAHYASIRNQTPTIAVIGTGLDISYPKTNARLQEYIGKHGLILSEYGPGQGPHKFHFPARNRIIAGLSMGVIVAEARIRSGSLITCERAMEEGREVFAIPGDILSGHSAGCHSLIKEGAKCITSGLDVLSEYPF